MLKTEQVLNKDKVQNFHFLQRFGTAQNSDQIKHEGSEKLKHCLTHEEQHKVSRD
jgi:hypothetical protein